MRTLSTTEAAKKIGVHRVNLQKAIAQGKVQPPPVLSLGPVKVRLWSLRDIERARKALKRVREVLRKLKKGKADRKRPAPRISRRT